MTPWDDEVGEVALEHLQAWRRCGLSLRDMVTAFGIQCPPIVTEDEVLLVIERAWLTVRRAEPEARQDDHLDALAPPDLEALPGPAADVLRLPDPQSMRRRARRAA